MSGIQNPYRYAYEAVAASATAQVLGTTGATGDYIDRLIVTVTTSGANGTIALIDGSTTILTVPASTAIGVYSIPVQAVSATGAWKVTTGSAATALGVGIFS